MLPKRLVIDALNYLPFFRLQMHWARRAGFAETETRVKEFRQILEANGVHAVFVFDNGQSSEEARRKWLTRRFREVRLEYRNIPYAAQKIFKSVVEKEGFEAFSPPGVDGDDAVAKLADHFDASILSADKDMSRYGIPSNRIFSSFAIDDGKLRLGYRPRRRRKYIKKRSLGDIELPKDLNDWKRTDNSMEAVFSSGKMTMGNADAYTKTLGNIHLIAQPLRAALYARLGGNDKVINEYIPIWKDGEPQLECIRVEPSKRYDALLNDHHSMYKWLLKRSGKTKSQRNLRQHPCAMIAAEIASSARPDQGRGAYEIYKSLFNFPAGRRPNSRPTWAQGSKCRGVLNSSCVGDGYAFADDLNVAKGRNLPRVCDACQRALLDVNDKKLPVPKKKKKPAKVAPQPASPSKNPSKLPLNITAVPKQEKTQPRQASPSLAKPQNL